MKVFLRLSIFFFLLFMICGGVRAQDPETLNLPFLPGPNYAGTRFFFAFPASWAFPDAVPDYTRLYILSAARTEVRVSVGRTLKKAITTRPDEVVSFDLIASEAQTLVRSDASAVPNDQVRQLKAVIIESNDPIVVYAVTRTSYTGEGMLLLPVSALGREYRVGSYHGISKTNQELPSQYLIAAPYAGTVVEICHPAGTPNHEKGETFTIRMDSADVFSAMSVGAGGDLSGAIIRSNKPIAVTAGVSCAYIPGQGDICCCGQLSEMLLPMESWGNHYKAVPIRTRRKGDFYRVVAKEPDTKISINGQPYATLSGGCGGEGDSWLAYRATGNNITDFSADKPISVYQYNASGGYDSVVSSPFYMALPPVQQYGTYAYISAPGEDFPQNYLTIVSDAEGLGGLEISAAGSGRWQPVTTLPGAEETGDFQEKVAGRAYRGFSAMLAPGVYRLRSTHPFSANIYGFDQFDAYGYPAAANARDLTISSTTPPALNLPDHLCVVPLLGVATSQAIDESNQIPLSLVGLVPGASDNFMIQDLDYAPGASARADFRLVPADLNRPGIAVVFAADIAGNVTYDTVRYDGGRVAHMSLSVNAVHFGGVDLGGSSEWTISLKNNGTDILNIDVQGILGGSPGFTLVDPLPSTVRLPALETLAITLRFSPAEPGPASDTLGLVFQDCRSGAYRIVLSGVGRVRQISVPDVSLPEVSALAVEPNPARGDRASVKFWMSRRGTVRVSIVDVLGEELRVTEPGTTVEAGTVRMPLDLAGLPSGSYFARILAGERSYTAPLVVRR